MEKENASALDILDCIGNILVLFRKLTMYILIKLFTIETSFQWLCLI